MKKKPPQHNTGMNSPTMKHMRKVGYDDLRIHASKTMARSERMRDDDAMLKAAEEKRQRKAQKVIARSKP